MTNPDDIDNNIVLSRKWVIISILRHIYIWHKAIVCTATLTVNTYINVKLFFYFLCSNILTKALFFPKIIRTASIFSWNVSLCKQMKMIVLYIYVTGPAFSCSFWLNIETLS